MAIPVRWVQGVAGKRLLIYYVYQCIITRFQLP